MVTSGRRTGEGCFVQVSGFIAGKIFLALLGGPTKVDLEAPGTSRTTGVPLTRGVVRLTTRPLRTDGPDFPSSIVTLVG